MSLKGGGLAGILTFDREWICLYIPGGMEIESYFCLITASGEKGGSAPRGPGVRVFRCCILPEQLFP